jgi:hypothetical protein
MAASGRQLTRLAKLSLLICLKALPFPDRWQGKRGVLMLPKLLMFTLIGPTDFKLRRIHAPAPYATSAEFAAFPIAGPVVGTWLSGLLLFLAGHWLVPQTP